jgi:hypothetical protein
VLRRRSQLIALITGGVVLFLMISAGITRIFNAESSERSAVTDLIKAEARGDRAGVVSLIEGCAASSACRARAAQLAQTLRRPGQVSVLEISSGTGFGLGGDRGTARIAWEIVDKTKPIVQCVRVRRTGSVVSGFRIELLKLSTRIKSDADCPKQF